MPNPRVVVATVPLVQDDTPLAAPAVLKASLQANDIECIGLDLNIEIWNKVKASPYKGLFLEFFQLQKIHEEIADDIVGMLDFCAREILAHSPDIVGLSLFCFQCQVFTAWLCAMLKQRAPGVKIVVGGPGLETLRHSLSKYPDRLKKQGLIDDYITGDAETSFVQYIKGNKDYPGINSYNWKPNENFNQLPMPDYSDYRFFHYPQVLLPIVDSRGCVQDCEFCDVITFWEKFQYLTAENIFSQMMAHIENYKVYRFQFSSSICNGNLREFKKLLNLIAHHNRTHRPAEHIHWIGSFIIRSATQHKEEMWQLIKETNGFLLCGVESVVEHVRIGLGKRFTNQDLEHHLVMAKKYQVPMNILIIAAYHSETEADYQYAHEWFESHAEYANNTVMQVQMTIPGVIPGTRLEKTIDFDDFKNKENMRLQQAHKLKETVMRCGFKVDCFF